MLAARMQHNLRSNPRRTPLLLQGPQSHRQCWLRGSCKPHPRPHLSRSVSTFTTDAPSAVSSTSDESETATSLFDWKKQWYPVAIIDDLPTDRPTATVILGKDLVVWRDKAEQWHVFEDKCPHRKVPLSEGRVETDGTLQCSYHGWRFNGAGACTTIPQARSEESEKQAAGAKRACATVYPTFVEDGLLYVWMDAGPDAVEESSRKQPQLVSDYLREGRTSYPWFMRELLQSWEVALENVTDPAHVPFAHHGVQGNRAKPTKPNFTKIESMGRDTGYVVSSPPEPMRRSPDPVITRVEVFPPNHYRLAAYNPKGAADGLGKRIFYLNIHLVPVTKLKTRMFARFEFDMLKDSKAALFIRNRPRWHDHLERNAVLDGDGVFLTRQSQHLQAGTLSRKEYYLATPADLPTEALRQWLRQWAPDGPDYYDDVTDPLEGQNTPPPRDVVLDRFEQHVKHCKSCSGALRNLRAGMRVIQVALAGAFLALAALLGRGQPLLSTAPLMAVGVMFVGVFAWHKLKAFERRFTFADYVHADR